MTNLSILDGGKVKQEETRKNHTKKPPINIINEKTAKIREKTAYGKQDYPKKHTQKWQRCGQKLK